MFNICEYLYFDRDSVQRRLLCARRRQRQVCTRDRFKVADGEIKKNSVTVPVFEIVDPMPFSKDRKKKKKPLQVGSVYEVNYNGNWNR